MLHDSLSFVETCYFCGAFGLPCMISIEFFFQVFKTSSAIEYVGMECEFGPFVEHSIRECTHIAYNGMFYFAFILHLKNYKILLPMDLAFVHWSGLILCHLLLKCPLSLLHSLPWLTSDFSLILLYRGDFAFDLLFSPLIH